MPSVRHPCASQATWAALIADPTRFPFVDRVLEIEEGLRLVTSCVLDPNQHRFLPDPRSMVSHTIRA